MKKIIVLFAFLIVILSLLPRKYSLVNDEVDNDILVDSIEINENGFLIGQIKILNSDLIFNIVQTDNNEFFLFHDEDGESSIEGNVFLDYRNDVSDRKLIIYGHNSEVLSDAPFHFLENYLDNEYVSSHDQLVFEGNGFSFLYELFTIMIVTDDFRHVNLKFDDISYYQHLLWLQTESQIEIPLVLDKDDSILLLQTCYYDPKPSYLVVGFRKK